MAGPATVLMRGPNGVRSFHQATNEHVECSCCGTSPKSKGWAVYKARLLSSDGDFYSLLCGRVGDGEGGCLRSLLDEQNEVDERMSSCLAAARSVLGNDTDAIQVLMEDLRDDIERELIAAGACEADIERERTKR